LERRGFHQSPPRRRCRPSNGGLHARRFVASSFSAGTTILLRIAGYRHWRRKPRKRHLGADPLQWRGCAHPGPVFCFLRSADFSRAGGGAIASQAPESPLHRMERAVGLSMCAFSLG